MTGKRPNTFRGKLDAHAAATGINAAMLNARRLAADAETLLKAGRFPSAAALAILSIEESGKVPLLRTLTVARSQKEVADAWRDYRSHTKKNVFWIVPALVARGARTLEAMRPTLQGDSDHPQVLDTLKQLATYTDCFAECHWSSPVDVIDESLARQLVQIADTFAKGREVSTTEMELWIKHLGPVWGREMGWMKKALTNWHQDLVAAGLGYATDDKFGDFIWGDGDKQGA